MSETRLSESSIQEIARTLKAARERQREELAEVAYRIALSPSQLRALESGNTAPFYSHAYFLQAAQRYAQAFGVQLPGNESAQAIETAVPARPQTLDLSAAAPAPASPIVGASSMSPLSRMDSSSLGARADAAETATPRFPLSAEGNDYTPTHAHSDQRLRWAWVGVACLFAILLGVTKIISDEDSSQQESFSAVSPSQTATQSATVSANGASRDDNASPASPATSVAATPLAASKSPAPVTAATPSTSAASSPNTAAATTPAAIQPSAPIASAAAIAPATPIVTTKAAPIFTARASPNLNADAEASNTSRQTSRDVPLTLPPVASASNLPSARPSPPAPSSPTPGAKSYLTSEASTWVQVVRSSGEKINIRIQPGERVEFDADQTAAVVFGRPTEATLFVRGGRVNLEPFIVGDERRRALVIMSQLRMP